MKNYKVSVKIGNKICVFFTTANTEYDAKQIIKGKLIDSLTNSKVELHK